MKELIKSQEYSITSSYISDIIESCFIEKLNTSSESLDLFTCSVQRFKDFFSKSSELDIDKVVETVMKSLEPSNNQEGEPFIDVLQNDKDQSYYFDYQQTPSIFINEELVRGLADPDLAVGAICDSMEIPISECSSVHRKQAKHLVELYEQREKELQNSFTLNTVYIIFIMVVIFFAGLWFFKRMINREFDRDIQRFAQNGVAEYHRIREDGTSRGRN